MMLIFIDIIQITIVLLFICVVYLLTKRALVNKGYDKKFGINTTGTRSWGKGSLYNRTESTPYMALNSFAHKYTMGPNDNLVDFGSGRSRVAIYMHNRFRIPVTGIELNDLTYDEAVTNVDSYLSNCEHTNAKLKIEKEYAEKYEIKESENKFFFFNPFDVSIFEKVVNNIIRSSIKDSKEVEIILYYPLKAYKDFLDRKTGFVLVKKINSAGAIGFTEKFLIYKLIP